MALVQFNWASCRAKIGRALYAISVAHEVVAISQREPKSPSPARSLRSKALQCREARTPCGNRDRENRLPGLESRAVPTARNAARDLVPNLPLRAESNRLRPAPVRRAKPDSAGALRH